MTEMLIRMTGVLSLVVLLTSLAFAVLVSEASGPRPRSLVIVIMGVLTTSGVALVVMMAQEITALLS